MLMLLRLTVLQLYGLDDTPEASVAVAITVAGVVSRVRAGYRATGAAANDEPGQITHNTAASS